MCGRNGQDEQNKEIGGATFISLRKNIGIMLNRFFLNLFQCIEYIFIYLFIHSPRCKPRNGKVTLIPGF